MVVWKDLQCKQPRPPPASVDVCRPKSTGIKSILSSAQVLYRATDGTDTGQSSVIAKRPKNRKGHPTPAHSGARDNSDFQTPLKRIALQFTLPIGPTKVDGPY
jgi:hypothetical protein